jgi:hypothetical protein
MRNHWLIVGHGTVGSFLSSRVLDAGDRVWIRDDDPRLTLPTAPDVTLVTAAERVSPSSVAVCVPAQAAASVGEYLRSSVEGHPLIYDWTSASPSAKVHSAGPMAGTWIDVALLDSLDRTIDRPLLSISGACGAEAATMLSRLGFDVAVAGDRVGQAAGVKLTRSLFMKSPPGLIQPGRPGCRSSGAWGKSSGNSPTSWSPAMPRTRAVGRRNCGKRCRSRLIRGTRPW